MLPDNERFRDFLGVTAWHKAGYTGKRGLTASAESFDGGHGYQTYSVFKEIAPDREAVTLTMSSVDSADGFRSKFIDEGIPTILDRRVDTMWGSISLSTDGAVYDEPLQPVLPFFTFFMSAGNDGADAYNQTLESGCIYGVGAYYLMYGTNDMNPANYSSVTDEVDFCAPTNVWVDGAPFSGTSCAAPVLAGMAALVNDFFLDKTGKPLSSEMMYQFFKDHCTDLKTAGKDTKTGWGAPILPPPETVDIERYAGKMLNSRDIDLLRPDVAANCKELVELAARDGYSVLVTGTVRDKEFQELCYFKGTSKNKVPTFHSEAAGLAFDVCKNVKGQEYSDNDFWVYVGALGKRMGFTWGGDWKSFVDKPHFQWDGNKKYSGTDILAGRYPPDMPLFKEEAKMGLSLNDAKAILKEKAGLADRTIEFMQDYRYGGELIIKLAEAINGGK